MDFHINLKAYRKSRGLTQENISNRLGIKRSTYAKYEIGENQPDYKTLERLADFFNISTDELLGRSSYDSTTKFRRKQTSLEEINEFVQDLGIESVGFFDIEKWKNLSQEDVADIKKHFEWIAHKAKERED